MILITGLSGSGKTYKAINLAKALGVQTYQTDDVYFLIAAHLGIERDLFINPYRWKRIPGIETLKDKMYPHYPDNAVIEGCGVFYDYKRFPSNSTIFILQPSYQTWLKQWSNYRINKLADTPDAKKLYEDNIKEFTPDKDFPEHYLVDDNIDLCAELNPPIAYSGVRSTYVKEKYDSLKLGDLDGLSVIDLGGNNGEIAGYCLDDGAEDVLVVDNNWQRLNRAIGFKKRLFNCEYLELFKDTADVLLSLSMIHYIKDKDKFIKQASRIAQKLFVLECPIDGYRQDAIVPSLNEIMMLLNKYFPKVEIVGKSPSPDSSSRLVFKGSK